MAKIVPEKLPARSAANPSDIDITVVPTGNPVPTTYAGMRAHIKELHDNPSTSDADLYVHLGRASVFDYVSVERAAFRQDMTSNFWQGARPGTSREYYSYPASDGKNVNDIGPCPWTDLGAPLGLSPAVDTMTVVENATEILSANKEVTSKRLTIKEHFEAGYFGCGFVFYESMANRDVKGKEINVLFCHVPGSTEKEELERARDAVVAVIVAAAKEFTNPDRKYRS